MSLILCVGVLLIYIGCDGDVPIDVDVDGVTDIDYGVLSDQCCSATNLTKNSSNLPSIDVHCGDCCTKSIIRYKCYIVKTIGDAIGARAKIETRIGKLCAEGHPNQKTLTAHSAAWVGIQQERKHKPGGNPQLVDFAQFGYMRTRSGDIYRTVLYVELRGISSTDLRGVHIETTDGVPTEGSSHKYEVKVNPTNGNISYLYDNEEFFTYGTTYWIGKSVQYVSWQGEINGRETDMPGSNANPATFEDCYYTKANGSELGGNFNTQDFIGVTPQDSGPAQWGISYTAGENKFNIWDENLLP